MGFIESLYAHICFVTDLLRYSSAASQLTVERKKEGTGGYSVQEGTGGFFWHSPAQAAGGLSFPLVLAQVLSYLIN